MPTWCNKVIYWYILSSICFGYIRQSSGALDAKLQHMVFCTKFLDEWRSLEPLRRSCVRFGWCSWWWAYAPETCRAKEISIIYIVASSWHFTLFQHLNNHVRPFVTEKSFRNNHLALAYTHTHVRTRTHTHTHTRMYAHVHTHTHTHTHTLLLGLMYICDMSMFSKYRVYIWMLKRTECYS